LFVLVGAEIGDVGRDDEIVAAARVEFVMGKVS